MGIYIGFKANKNPEIKDTELKKNCQEHKI